MRRAFIAVAALSLIVLLPGAAGAADHNVTIQNFAFHDGASGTNTTTINEGDAVVFTNKDNIGHTATADDGSFDTSPGCTSGTEESCLKPNEPFKVTFLSAGNFPYHCNVHKSMTGTIIVNAASTTTTEPATTTTEAVTTPASSSSSATTSTSTSTTTTSSTTTSSTTTTSSSTTTTTSTTTTLPSSASAPVTINDKSGGDGSSAVPWLLGGAAVVAGLAALAYWLWWRSGEPPVDQGPDWTQEPPPTTQGPRI